MSKKWMFIIILFLALAAAIYAPQKTLSVETYRGVTSVYNTEWNGISELVDLLKEQYKNNVWNVNVEVEILRDLSILKENIILGRNGKLHDVLVIIGPDKPYSGEEIEIIRDFLDDGGSILIADELGTVNNLINTLFGSSISTTATHEYLSYINSGATVDWRGEVTLPILIAALETEPPIPILVNGTYSLSLDLPSYFEKMGSLKLCGTYYTLISGQSYGPLSLAGSIDTDLSKVFVIADTSIFINKYVGREVNRRLIRNLFNWLTNLYNYSGGGADIKIYIDESHHIPISLELPLPHIGMIIANYLEFYGSEINRYFYEYIIYASTPTKLLIILSISMSIYTLARRWHRGPIVEDIPLKHVVERKILVYSPEYENMRIKIKRRGIYKRLIGDLYNIVNFMLSTKLGISVEDLVVYNRGWDKLSIYIGDEADIARYKSVFRELYKIRCFLEGKVRIILVFRWKHKFNYFINMFNPLLKKLGFELRGD